MCYPLLSSTARRLKYKPPPTEKRAGQFAMEKQAASIARHHNGVLKLPPGFRFHPTDEELVVQYLRRKVFSCPLPASFIPDIDLGKFNPWDLPDGCEQERYFFALRAAKYPTGNRSNRSTSCGYWKATGKDRTVVAARLNQVVGMKKSLVFYRGNAPRGSRTDWIMHEYRLSTLFPQSAASVPAGDWVLCRIFMKKRPTKTGSDAGGGAVGFIAFMGGRPPSPTCSACSCVTESADASSNGEDATSSP